MSSVNHFLWPLPLPQDPKVYVEALLQVHTRYSQLVSMAFEGKPMFVGALDRVSGVVRLKWFIGVGWMECFC